MYQLSFVSTSVHTSQKDLDTILACASQLASKLNVTGMLIYRQGNFMSLLEGEEAAVKALFAEACQSPLHNTQIVIDEGPIAQRQFSAWSSNVSHGGGQPIFSETELRGDKNGSMRIINQFVENMR